MKRERDTEKHNTEQQQEDTARRAVIPPPLQNSNTRATPDEVTSPSYWKLPYDFSIIV